MSKLNTARPLASPIVTLPDAVLNAAGLPGHARDAKSELFLLAISNMVGEDTFYEGASARDQRYRDLVRLVAAADTAWMARFIPWLRNTANMRSASIVAAAEACYALRDVGLPKRAGVVHTDFAPHPDSITSWSNVSGRDLVVAAIARADEPAEMLAYCINRYGRKLPMSLKKGIGDAARTFFTEFNYLKWDSDKRAVRWADVLDITHPSNQGQWQRDLYTHILDERHGHPKELPQTLGMLIHREVLMNVEVSDRRTLIEAPTAPDMLRRAGMTWESIAGWLQGPMDKAAWEAAIPGMGYMALLRNLRNFDQAKVSDVMAKIVAQRIADPEQVAKSRQFPLRFVAAYRAAPSLRWSWALEQAIQASLDNVPALRGRTLILVDRSRSMFGGRISDRSELTWAEGAALFGSALALRADQADLVQFGGDSHPVRFQKSESLLKLPERFSDFGSTNTPAAVQSRYNGHDRVIILTDEQNTMAVHNPNFGYGFTVAPRATIGDLIPPAVPLYVWNLAGYRTGGVDTSQPNRHVFGGLTDAAFTMLATLEGHRDAQWPF